MLQVEWVSDCANSRCEHFESIDVVYVQAGSSGQITERQISDLAGGGTPVLANGLVRAIVDGASDEKWADLETVCSTTLHTL